MANNIRIGIVILNYNSWEDTKACILSIRKATNDLSYKIYVVDNNSPAEPPAEIFSLLTCSTDIFYIRSKENKGYASGNNIGINSALNDGCKYILICNNDIVFLETSIKRMLDGFRIDEKIGIVGPMVKMVNGKIQKSTKFLEIGLKQKYLAETLLRKIFIKYRNKYYGSNKDYKNTSIVFSVSGCCFTMNRDCALNVTPLDENTFLYSEEVIIGKRMIYKGFKTLYYPESIVIHKHEGSTKNIKALTYIHRVKSEIYYCRKYLKSEKIKLMPLYIIRTTSYLVFALLKKSFRKNLLYYFQETWSQFVLK